MIIRPRKTFFIRSKDKIYIFTPNPPFAKQFTKVMLGVEASDSDPPEWVIEQEVEYRILSFDYSYEYAVKLKGLCNDKKIGEYFVYY